MLQDDKPIFKNTERPRAQQEEDEVSFEAFLERERKLRDFKEEGWYYWVRVCSLGLMSLIAFSCVFSYVAHLVMPLKWHWLSHDQLSNMKDIVITIITGAIVSQGTTFFLSKKK